MSTRTSAWIACAASLMITTSCLTARTQSNRATTLSARGVAAEDIILNGGSTAYDGIELLRPAFLTGRSLEPPAVYVDGVPFPDVESLRDIRASEVQSMEYLDASSATIRYGIGHQGGAILVVTRRDS